MIYYTHHPEVLKPRKRRGDAQAQGGGKGSGEGKTDAMEVEEDERDNEQEAEPVGDSGGEAMGEPNMAWVEAVREKERKEGGRLDVELRGYSNNLIKESIRVGVLCASSDEAALTVFI
jgi:hypothetical protein